MKELNLVVTLVIFPFKGHHIFCGKGNEKMKTFPLPPPPPPNENKN